MLTVKEYFAAVRDALAIVLKSKNEDEHEQVVQLATGINNFLAERGVPDNISEAALLTVIYRIHESVKPRLAEMGYKL